MKNTLPLDMLIALAQTSTDEATRRLGRLQQAQSSAAATLEMLTRYRQEYCDRLQSLMRQGLPSSHWRNFQDFIATLDDAIERQRALATEADASLTEGRGDWQRNKRRLSSFDTLADRLRRQEALVQGRREQRDNDEYAARQFRLRASTLTD